MKISMVYVKGELVKFYRTYQRMKYPSLRLSVTIC